MPNVMAENIAELLEAYATLVRKGDIDVTRAVFSDGAESGLITILVEAQPSSDDDEDDEGARPVPPPARVDPTRCPRCGSLDTVDAKDERLCLACNQSWLPSSHDTTQGG